MDGLKNWLKFYLFIIRYRYEGKTNGYEEVFVYVCEEQPEEGDAAVENRLTMAARLKHSGPMGREYLHITCANFRGYVAE